MGHHLIIWYYVRNVTYAFPVSKKDNHFIKTNISIPTKNVKKVFFRNVLGLIQNDNRKKGGAGVVLAVCVGLSSKLSSTAANFCEEK